MSPIVPTEAPPLPQTGSQAWFVFAALLILVALALILLPRLTRTRYKFPQPEAQG
jgi:LPXTG-motif cell wall-anchored protein